MEKTLCGQNPNNEKQSCKTTGNLKYEFMHIVSFYIFPVSSNFDQLRERELSGLLVASVDPV